MDSLVKRENSKEVEKKNLNSKYERSSGWKSGLQGEGSSWLVLARDLGSPPPLLSHLLVFVFQVLEVCLGFCVFLLHLLQLQGFRLHDFILACHLQQGLHLKEGRKEERVLREPL